MSDQFLELKKILHASANLGPTPEHTVRDAQIDVLCTSSDDSSSASDLTLPGVPTPVSTVANSSLLNPDVLQLIAQDLSHIETTG